ncbi:hypothetical protein F4777DRAFT_594859 [Nemania sp. FL0916]|nr:hypothetical protein F4777DRAFT_594859 [Nemania sp. FL0916]
MRYDVNRLLRFAICRNNVDIVEEMRHCFGNKFDLNCRDLLGRSAIFYAVWPFPDNNMLKHFSSQNREYPVSAEYRDIKDKTPLYYAVQFNSADAVEYVLAMEPVRGIEPEPYLSRTIDRRRQIDCLNTVPCIDGLLGLEKHLPTSDRESRWVNHTGLPFVGIVFFSLLRRCGETGERSIDARKTAFIKVRENPYTDHSYISNLEEFSDAELYLGRQVYIVFPLLILRSQNSHTKAKRIIQTSKRRNAEYFLNSILRSERTIDETYFPSLSAESLETRDASQVVSREHTDETKRPILVVPNIWIWRLGRSIYTTYSANCGLDKWGDKMMIGRWNDWQPRPGILIGHILAQHVLAFGNPQADGDFPPPLDIFERGVVRILQEVTKYIDPGRALRPEIEKEHGFMFRIADIREELVMIQEILTQQLEIFENLIEDFENRDPDIKDLLDPRVDPADLCREKDKEHWKTIKIGRGKIQKYLKRVNKIDSDAERVEKRIQESLNLKWTHSSIHDAHTGLLLSTAVIGFTVITVIFAPLAFMTALFALPIDILARNQFLSEKTSDESNTADKAGAALTPTYSTRYVITWFAVAEVASLAITILLVAISLWFLRSADDLSAFRGSRRSTDTETSRDDSATDNHEKNGSTARMMDKVKNEFVRTQVSLSNKNGSVWRRGRRGMSSNTV